MLACDIQNTYPTEECRERLWVVARTEFGSETGKNMLVRKALYGLKSSGASLRPLLVEALDAMGYRPSYSDPYLWLRPKVKPGGFKYYESILCYVYNVLCISHNPRKSMKRIKEDLKHKYDKIEPPGLYIGATLDKMKLESGKYCWTVTTEQYAKAAVTNV